MKDKKKNREISAGTRKEGRKGFASTGQKRSQKQRKEKEKEKGIKYRCTGKKKSEEKGERRIKVIRWSKEEWKELKIDLKEEEHSWKRSRINFHDEKKENKEGSHW